MSYACPKLISVGWGGNSRALFGQPGHRLSSWSQEPQGHHIVWMLERGVFPKKCSVLDEWKVHQSAEAGFCCSDKQRQNLSGLVQTTITKVYFSLMQSLLGPRALLWDSCPPCGGLAFPASSILWCLHSTYCQDRYSRERECAVVWKWHLSLLFWPELARARGGA